jgi:2-hydroxychromene-2-carboxylate isomerase
MTTTSGMKATLSWKPMFLGGLFKNIGQSTVPLATWSQAKQRYTKKDMERWAAYYEVPFTWPTRFPMSSLKAMRCYMAMGDAHQAAFRASTFRAAWGDDRDISDDAVLRELLAAAGASADDVLARAQTPAGKQGLIDATQRAADKGVFGAPSWIVGDEELFWGQDRIPLVERALVR